MIRRFLNTNRSNVHWHARSAFVFLGLFVGLAPACKKREFNANAEPPAESSSVRTDTDVTLFSCELGKIQFTMAYHSGAYEINGAPVNVLSVSKWQNDDASEINYRVTTLDSGEFVIHIHPGEVADELEKVGVSNPCTRDGAANIERLDKMAERYKPAAP